MIKKLGPRIQDPGLWHINRRSVSGAVSLGLFCAFIPFPFQMLLAAIGAIIFRVNILIAVPIVWVSNPITIPPIFYFCYLVGVWLLGASPGEFSFELTFAWLANELSHIWQPFLLGCLVVSTVSAIVGFLAIRILWRIRIFQHIQDRKLRTPKSRNTDPS